MFLAKSESGSEAPKMASRPACKKHKREIRQFPGPFLKGGGWGGGGENVRQFGENLLTNTIWRRKKCRQV